MKNILNQPDRARVIERLNQLTPTSQRQWGKMSAEEMLWHCRAQIELALNERTTAKKGEGMLAFPPVRWLALYGPPWPKGAMTAPEMNVENVQPDLEAFEQERRLLFEKIEAFLQTTDHSPHPLFGKMSQRDWGRVVWKHLDHHLRQFGQ